MQRRSPRHIGPTLELLSDRWAPASLLGEIQRVWPEVVGSAIADEARPTVERGGILTISCSASVWAQELDLMGPAIVERLNGRLTGAPQIKRLRCVYGA